MSFGNLIDFDFWEDDEKLEIDLTKNYRKMIIMIIWI